MSYIGNQPTSVAFLTDQFSGTGSQTAFTLSAAPANTASIIVAVSGVLQDPTTYSTSGLTLTFSAAPPSGTGNISVRFLGIPASNITTTAYRTLTEFTATAGQTTFTVPSYTVGYISVYRNGVMLGTADFTATNGTTVVLATGATAGDLITTESFYVSSVLNAIPATAGAVTNAYLGAISTFTTPTSNTVTLPDATGTVMVSGNMPAFSAYKSAAQSITGGANTKVQFDAETFDTNSNFDTTNNRFTPTVAGYYQINATVMMTNTTGFMYAIIYKNGTNYSRGSMNNANASSYPTATASNVIYCNGSTDYIEIYAYFSATNDVGGGALGSATGYSSFTGALVRAA